ncbi:hypothetical protein [Arthrobacter sp. M4]|uniref:hypothetical protein n=1 Tax=Arthrobacter sp. M4 TaxID=218160 RepID=UPI001CDBBBAA|nr:hypothetical protein [Arthrobacter sp. M4]MCA4132965.1 hypothetical protein [Arthrobacter sp. M4]
MTHPFFSDPSVASLLTPDVVAFLLANQPPEDSSPEFRAGYWAGKAAIAHLETLELRQRIRELEADA